MSDNRPNYGAKTKIGAAAAQKAFDEGYGKRDKEDLSNRIAGARDEADNEVQRETTRGVRPMKSGGKVSSASKRADGCAIRGKTKGKMV